MGLHLAQVVESLRQRQSLQLYFCSAPDAGDSVGSPISSRLLHTSFRFTPLRFSPGGKVFVAGVGFDRAVARRLPLGRSFVGFAGAALASFARARKRGYGTLFLESPTCHVKHVMRMHERAHADFPIEKHWLSDALVRRTEAEYDAADRIIVASEYARDSFLAEGFDPERLERRTLRPSPRFLTDRTLPPDGIFRVVYCGALSAVKGVHLLIRAFSSLPGPAKLTLVGGWSTRSMREFLLASVARDPRIVLQPGDPLPHLREACAYVHPSYQDGLGLAALEAMACGVPVIVSSDTGMKEYVRHGLDGIVVPTGDWRAIREGLEELRRRCVPAMTRRKDSR